MARLREKYKQEIVPVLAQEFGCKNVLGLPRLTKVVVSMGVGRATQDKKLVDSAAKDLATIVGQKPLACKARKSVSNFKVRRGQETGVKVTLRKDRMWEFLDRLISLAIPRVRDFRGLDPDSFDGRGNYSMGLSEQSVFPEIDPNKVENQQGMNITIVTTDGDDARARRLLTLMGMPFRS